MGWNIAGYVIASLSLQFILILLAPLRRRSWGIRGKVLDLSIWSAYLLANSVAIGSIRFILSNETESSCTKDDSRVQLQVLWAPFLLVYLGGPDNITSYALEDNELWKRHALGLIVQVSYTLYVIRTFGMKELVLPAVLVLVAGIIRYAERTCSFYFASFNHFGNNWVASKWEDKLPIPEQLKNVDRKFGKELRDDEKKILWSAVHHLGSIKRILVGPLLSRKQCYEIGKTFRKIEDDDALQIMEIELSLLYEALHTKLPVIDCWKGYIFRVISIFCIVGALLWFWLSKNPDEWPLFDIRITYGLFFSCLILDSVSFMFLICSDWFSISSSPCILSFASSIFGGIGKGKKSIFKGLRWSKKVSQSNFFTYHGKDYSSWLKKVAAVIQLESLLEDTRRFRCLSCKSFTPEIWKAIVDTVKELDEDIVEKMEDLSEKVIQAEEFLIHSRKLVGESFRNNSEPVELMNYTQLILTWHIATQLCFQEYQGQRRGRSAADGQNNVNAEYCKLFSDYMFCLAIMESAMMTAVSVDWKTVFEDTLTDLETLERESSILIEKKAWSQLASQLKNNSVLCAAYALADQLKEKGFPWESMSKAWVQMMCFAAVNCKPSVHAQQPSKGGELLTFVWLYMNHSGFRSHLFSH